jgi:amino acid adenylation domain-containing protein
MLIFHNEVQETETEIPLTPGLSLVHYPVPVTTSKYDLTLVAVEDRGRLKFNVEYCRALFKPGTIRRMMGDFNRYLRAVLDNPAAKLGRVEILSAEEKQQLVEEFNNTRTDYPAYKTVKQLLAEQALKTPDRIAVTAKEGVLPGHRWVSLTYRELHEMARRAAWRLKEQYGIRAGDLVACRLSRTLAMITGILAVIKADGVCLPISPQCPPARLELIMKDSCARVVLTDEDIDIKAAQAPPASELEDGRDAREPAYVIYTSGSTGRPKGVLLSHHGIINHLYSLFKEFGLTGADVFCHNMDISYVVSIWLLVGPPVMGARVFLYPGEIAANALELFRQAEIHGVTVLEVVPPLLKTHLQLLDAGESPVCFRHLRSLILTGERVPPALVNRFYDRYRDRVQLCNAYGQSEGSDDTLYYKIPYNTQTVTVPIGKPSNNTIAFILDRCMNLQPIGIPGELYIAGDCLAPGYLNKPELTAEKFKKNRSYRTYRTYIFFKTGDLARWLASGDIEFLGRTDHQVKIRGFRIEPAEIENRLLEPGEIKEAVVVAREDEGGDTFLTAYIVGDRPLDISNLRAFLVRQLPDYMVPSHIIQVENIPLTASGKVNRNALPAPDRSRPGLETTYVAPRTGLEKEFCEICKRVLKRDQVGIHDNFFELGCNSLMLVQLNTEIKNVFQEDFPVLAMYRHPTIHSLLGYLESGGEKNTDTAGAAGMGIEAGEEKEQRMNRAKQLMKRAVRRRENGKPGRGHAF